MTSTYDAAEGIATPSPESDLDYEQLRDMLASPLFLQERQLFQILGGMLSRNQSLRPDTWNFQSGGTEGLEKG